LRHICRRRISAAGGNAYENVVYQMGTEKGLYYNDLPGVDEPPGDIEPEPEYSEPAERAARWKEGKIPVGQLSRNKPEREKQWLDGKCGSWCLDKGLFDAFLRLGVIDKDGFLTERAFTG
jgi:hypothetical protein